MIATLALASALSRFVVMHVTVDAYGVPGTGTIVVDRQTGRFARRFSAGPASEQEGWDGKDAWRADATGIARIQGNSGEQHEIAQWSSALSGAIDAVPHDVKIEGATDRAEIDFSGYRRFGNAAIPGHIVFRSVQNGEWTADVRSAEVLSNVSSAVFLPPHRTTPDFRLDHVTSIPISMDIGSPALDVRVNGKTLHFLFDTGGQNVITADAAKRIGLPVEGHGIVSGGGGGTTTVQYATAKSVQVGDAQLFDQPFIVLPADSLPGVDGIVGYELLARFCARLDMAHGTLELAPNANAFGPAVAPEHFQYFDRQPQVAGSLDGISGAFSIDTGSSLTAAVQTPVVRDQHLVQRMHATVIAYANDVGGRYPIYLVRAGALHLGSASFADPLVDLLVRAGTGDDASIVANVGDGILRRWIIVFDYANQTIDLRPGGDPQGNVVHDRSGIVLSTKAGGIVAAQVLGGTPAAEAGIADGARIVALNGSPVDANDVARVRTALRGMPGTVVELRLADGSSRRLVLRKYL